MTMGPEVPQDPVKFLGKKVPSDGQLIFLGISKIRRIVIRLILDQS
jgi:hypothetical protein